MKKLFLLLAVVAFVFTGCYEDIEPDVPKVGGITLSYNSMKVDAEGGDFSVDITADYPYEAVSNVDWVEIKGSISKVESHTLYFVVKQNDTTSPREGVIAVSCDDYNLSATLTISQEAGKTTPNNGIPNNEIWYTATAKVVPYYSGNFGANIVSNEWDETTGKGVITFDAPVTSIGEYAFCHFTSLTSITIPDSVTSIGDEAFSYCYSLPSITIPNSVTSIGRYAFAYCTSLTSVTIPDSVTSIGGYVFYNCTSLKAVYGKFASDDNRCLIVNGVLNSFAPAGLTEYTIPDSVTSIGEYAFYSCTSLTSVTIPDSVTSIGGSAFEYCTSLKEVYCKATTPPTGGTVMFCSNATGRKIYVPRASVEAYKATYYWYDYADYIVGYDF